VFDTQSDRLETVKIYLMKQSDAQLIFEVNRIEYNQPIDPSVFSPELPGDATWMQEGVPTLPDNDKYAGITAQQAARVFFEACGREIGRKLKSSIPADR